MIYVCNGIRCCCCSFFFFRFKLASLLTKHEKTHKETNFKCDQCGKTFRYKQSLSYHLESHTGAMAKPFVCDFCDKTFRMKRHLQVFTCEFCIFFSILFSFENLLSGSSTNPYGWKTILLWILCVLFSCKKSIFYSYAESTWFVCDINLLLLTLMIYFDKIERQKI